MFFFFLKKRSEEQMICSPLLHVTLLPIFTSLRESTNVIPLNKLKFLGIDADGYHTGGEAKLPHAVEAVRWQQYRVADAGAPRKGS